MTPTDTKCEEQGKSRWEEEQVPTLRAREIADFLREIKTNPDYIVTSNHRRHLHRLVRQLHEGKFPCAR